MVKLASHLHPHTLRLGTAIISIANVLTNVLAGLTEDMNTSVRSQVKLTKEIVFNRLVLILNSFRLGKMRTSSNASLSSKLKKHG